MTINLENQGYLKRILVGRKAKNLLSLVLLLVFVLIVWKVSSDIDEMEISSEQISNYADLISNNNKEVEEFKKGIKLEEITEDRQFIELRQEDNLIREGINKKEGNLFIKKF